MSEESLHERPTKDCPYCGEPILTKALKCKHCGSNVQAAERKQRTAKQVTQLASNRRFRLVAAWFVGAAILIVGANELWFQYNASEFNRQGVPFGLTGGSNFDEVKRQLGEPIEVLNYQDPPDRYGVAYRSNLSTFDRILIEFDRRGGGGNDPVFSVSVPGPKFPSHIDQVFRMWGNKSKRHGEWEYKKEFVDTSGRRRWWRIFFVAKNKRDDKAITSIRYVVE